MVGVCEALLYAHRAGLNLDAVLESVSSGAAGSWSLSNLAPRMIRGDFAPGFYVEHFLKDMGIVARGSAADEPQAARASSWPSGSTRNWRSPGPRPIGNAGADAGAGEDERRRVDSDESGE